MAYISNSRQRIADIIQGTIARDTRSPEGSGASKPWDKNNQDNPDYTFPNSKDRKRLRESGQPEPKQLDLFSLRNLQRTGRAQQAGQRNFDPRRPLSFIAEPMRIAREYRFSDPRSGNPLSIMHHQSGKTSVDPGTPDGTRYYWGGGEVPPTDIPAKINPFPGAMIPEDDNNRIIPENPGRPMMISGIYSSNKSGDTDEVWDVQREIGPQTPFRAGPTSEKVWERLQQFKQKYFQGV